MGRGAAIGVDDDLAAGEAGVAIGAADEELAGWIDVPDCVPGDPALRQGLLHIGFHQGEHVGRGHALVDMLVRDDNLGGGDGFAVTIGDGHLALRVGAETGLLATVASLGQEPQDAVRIVERCRHEFRRLVTGIAEHDALIAGALVLLFAGIDTLRNIG